MHVVLSLQYSAWHGLSPWRHVTRDDPRLVDLLLSLNFVGLFTWQNNCWVLQEGRKGGKQYLGLLSYPSSTKAKTKLHLLFVVPRWHFSHRAHMPCRNIMLSSEPVCWVQEPESGLWVTARVSSGSFLRKLLSLARWNGVGNLTDGPAMVLSTQRVIGSGLPYRKTTTVSGSSWFVPYHLANTPLSTHSFMIAKLQHINNNNIYQTNSTESILPLVRQYLLST